MAGKVNHKGMRRGAKVNVERPVPANQSPKVARGEKIGALGRRLRARGKSVRGEFVLRLESVCETDRDNAVLRNYSDRHY
jgi:hypothetical protein